MSAIAKEFVLTNIFKNVSEMKEGINVYSEEEECFGVPWKLLIKRIGQNLGVFLHCSIDKTEKWQIEVDRDLKLITVTGKVLSRKQTKPLGNAEGEFSSWGFRAFTTWDELMKDYVIDDCVTVEAHLKILRMTGVDKKKLRSFDKSTKELSDVILIVEDQKFFVLKLFLASQSTFFKALFLDNLKKLPVYSLSNSKAKDFQNFLELLYGESSIDESTIEGILHLAHQYDAKTAIQKCEQFLIENSEKTLKEKLKLAHRYKLENLKIKCLSKITTAAEIRSVLSHDSSEMDPSVVGALLQKSLSLIP
ncbi:hypothetical protein B9Z55_007086 [Caenorhabditis nigoni]|uniref:BTB domain-containing protein n=1 Tax=Caenorhabditis nigoni TaxID=1611254 RepID=A0A2G5V872_9PELO|nr:hypothetical protein B9Z55_007086 [Caenorhabditis nigoni]